MGRCPGFRYTRIVLQRLLPGERSSSTGVAEHLRAATEALSSTRGAVRSSDSRTRARSLRLDRDDGAAPTPQVSAAPAPGHGSGGAFPLVATLPECEALVRAVMDELHFAEIEWSVLDSSTPFRLSDSWWASAPLGSDEAGRVRQRSGGGPPEPAPGCWRELRVGHKITTKLAMLAL